MDRGQDLLIAREARSLERSIVARIALVGLMGAFSLLHLVRVLDSGVVAETDAEALTTLVLAMLGLTVAWRGRVLAQRRQHLSMVGMGVVILDVLALGALPILWLKTGGQRDPDPAFLLKNELVVIATVLIAINAMSLRPRYPALMTAGAVGVHLVLLFYVLRDPRVVTTDSYHEHFTTAAVNVGLVTVRIGALTMIGVVLYAVTRNARRVVQDTVELHAANARMREQQAQLVMEGRMNAIASLVAGVAHELNSPLGAVSSSLQTARRAADRLGDAHDPERRARMLTALADSADAGAAAVRRLEDLVESLKRFASLDRAEVQRISLDDALGTTLAVIDEGLRGGVEIRVERGGVPAVLCRPQEINQVLRTLVINALEALGGRGTLRLVSRLHDGRVELRVIDDGPGMDPAQLSSLFDVSIGDRRGRMGIGLGLLAGRRILEQHGGALTVESTRGEGTTVTMQLPLHTPLENN